jgi:NAD(P)-dependent dehydrogenase (short-subunit alcohol dehydrogenase family)
MVGRSHYCACAASKARLIHSDQAARVGAAPENIVVSTIAPGAFASNMNKLARDQAEAVSERIPARRIGTPEDMADAAIFLASRAGDYVVGATLVVDRGVPGRGRDSNDGMPRGVACRSHGI